MTDPVPASPGAAGPSRHAGDVRPATDESGLWATWIKGRDRLIRTQLILLYLPFARSIARLVLNGLVGDYLEFGDLVQYATVGLIEAINRFDPGRGVPFKAFADKRVRGAVMDGISTTSEMHAQLTFRQQHRRERIESLRPAAGSRDEAELFAEMVDMTLGLAVGLMLEDTTMFQGDTAGGRTAPEHGYGDPGELAARADLFQRLLQRLPESERAVLELHYANGVQFNEIARMLDLSKGRISQLHKSALNKLRQLARDRAELDLKI